MRHPAQPAVPDVRHRGAGLGRRRLRVARLRLLRPSALPARTRRRDRPRRGGADLRRHRGRHRSVGRRHRHGQCGRPAAADMGRRRDRVSPRSSRCLPSPPSIGLANGLGVALLRVHPMIMTLAMATFLQGLLIIIAGGSAITAQNPLVAWLGNARPGGIPAGILLWLAMAAVTLFVMHATPLGARIFAIGANPLAARLSGVPVNATTTLGLWHQRLHVGTCRGAGARHERAGLCRHRRSLPAGLDRRRGAWRHVDPRRRRHLCRHASPARSCWSRSRR